MDRCVCRRILYNVCALLCVGVCWGLRCLPARPNATPLTHCPASSRVLAPRVRSYLVRACGNEGIVKYCDFFTFPSTDYTYDPRRGGEEGRGEAKRRAEAILKRSSRMCKIKRLLLSPGRKKSLTDSLGAALRVCQLVECGMAPDLITSSVLGGDAALQEIRVKTGS